MRERGAARGESAAPLERRNARSRPVETATPGSSSPLGATLRRDGVNFSIFSKHATGLDLLLFDHVDDAEPSRVIFVDPPPTAPITTGTCSSPD